MARTPSQTDRKAEGYAMLAGGATLDEVAEKTGVAKSTVQGWAEKVKQITGQKPEDIRLTRFEHVLENLLCDAGETVRALQSQMRDPQFLRDMLGRSGGPDDAIKLIGFSNEQAIAIASFAAGLAVRKLATLPEHQPSALEAELVDA